VRTTKSVLDCLAAVKALSQLANSAGAFREKCSNLLGAAIAANLALQEVCLVEQQQQLMCVLVVQQQLLGVLAVCA
jgi:hypothetical protein